MENQKNYLKQKQYYFSFKNEMLLELSETNEQVEVVCVDLTSCNGMPIQQ